MSIGNILIRPQMLERHPGDEGAQALDLLTGLASRLTEDFIRGGAASRKMVEALQQEAGTFTAQFEPRLNTTKEHLLEWLQPYLSVVENLAGLDINGADDILPVVDKLLELADQLLNDLHTSNIAGRLNALADIVENDLGIGKTTFENFFTGCFDRATEALARDFLQGSQSEEAVNHFALSRQLLALRRLLRHFIAEAPLPAFNRRALVRELQLQLEASKWDERLDEIRGKLSDAKDKLLGLLPTLRGTLSVGGSRSPRRRDAAAPGQHSWYGSWFRGKGTAVANRFDLSAESFAPEIRLDPIPLGFLEHWAHITFVLDEAARALLYGLQMDNGNRISPALNMGWQIGTGLTSLLAFFVDGKTWADYYGVKTNSTFRLLVDHALTFGGSFEQLPSFRGWLWATWPHDRDNLSNGQKWSKAAYDFFLTFFTLINSQSGGSQKNHEKIAGFTKLGRTGGAYLGALMIGRTGWYYSVFSGNFGISVVSILLGGAVTFAGEVIAWLLAGALGGRLSDRYWRFESDNAGDGIIEFFSDENAFGSFLLWSYIEFYGTWGSFWEGKTDGGKLGLKTLTLADNTTEHQQIRFAGYAPKSGAPYRLPYETNRTVFCAQAHMGFSSHNFNTGLLYAVNFLLGDNQVVLAMRGGTITEFRDNLANGADAGTNYIVVRHDEINPDHDKGENGTLVMTFARYETAQPFGIRQAFALMGIPETHIIGARVIQGFPLMVSGERPGVFETDYLQVRVSAATNGGSLLSIPFVFADVPDGGVPVKGKYYTSGNINRIDASLSHNHPYDASGWVVATGTDFIELSSNAARSNDAYVGQHLFVKYLLPEGGAMYEYKKIRRFEAQNRRAFIEGSWSAGHPPAVNALYKIGNPDYAHASDWEKHFGYLAARDGSDAAVNFSDGRRPYRLSNTLSQLQAPLASGIVIGGGVAGTSEVHLGGDASAMDNVYNFCHIAIRRNGKIIQYREIIAYRIETDVKKVYINGVWDENLQTAGTFDEYLIGAAQVNQPQPPNAWFAPDADLDRYTPKPFVGGYPPARYYPIPLIS